MTDPEPGVDPKPRAVLYEHARWLFDSEESRLSSIESRATALLGWSGTQLTITLGASLLVSDVPESRWRTIGLCLLAASVLFSVIAIGVLFIGVMWARTVPAPNRDVRDRLEELKTEDWDTHDRRFTELHVYLPLLENLIEPGDKHPDGALLGLSAAITSRATRLNIATGLVAVALVCAGGAALAFATAAQGAQP